MVIVRRDRSVLRLGFIAGVSIARQYSILPRTLHGERLDFGVVGDLGSSFETELTARGLH